MSGDDSINVDRQIPTHDFFLSNRDFYAHHLTGAVAHGSRSDPELISEVSRLQYADRVFVKCGAFSCHFSDK